MIWSVLSSLLLQTALATDIRGSQPVQLWDEYTQNHATINQNSSINQLAVQPYGSVQTSAPTAGANAASKLFTLDAFGRLGVSQAPALNAEWGQMFHAGTNLQALTGTTEVGLIYFKNPTGSGKTAKFYRMDFGPTLGNNYVTYVIYLDPTVTSNGTTITPTGNRQTSQASTISQVFLNPTVTANGSYLKSLTASGLSGQDVILPYDFSLWVEANHSLLITRHLSANATIGGVDMEWAEQ